MGILDEDVVRVREQTDLVALVSEHIALKRVGRRFTGLCPFHQEKSPSFSVNPELGLFHCFGCQKSGDAITFIREIEHLDFVEAVERLASRSNISLRYDNETHSKDRARKGRLIDAVREAVDFYHHRLLEASDSGPARKYLRGRGFEGEVVRQFSLGWAPEGMDGLSQHLQGKKFGRQDIVDAGLAFVNRTNRLQDQFRARLMFPIFDSRGEPVGFGGRSLTNDGPKYKNSPENPIYQKSRLLYGLNWAKGEIVAQGEVVICEGYTDVMGFALAGVPTSVATCGTALTDEHFQILKNLARKVILAYDADAAGQSAAQRWYHWEQQHELQLYVATLPEGKDPGDVWHDNPADLKTAVAQAKPFMEFRIDRVLAQANKSTPEGRARAADQVLPIIREHPNEFVRDGYIAKFAATVGLDPQLLKDRLTRSGRQSSPEVVSQTPESRVDARELEVLRLAIHMPELVVHRLDQQLFVDPVAKRTYEVLAAADTFHQALEGADEQVRPVLERLAVEEPEAGEQLEVYVAELLANITETAGRRFQQKLLETDDDRASEVSQLLDTLVGQRASGDWHAVDNTAQKLLTWMFEPANG